MYFNNQQQPGVIVIQQDPPAKEKIRRKMTQPVLLSLALAYAQRCVDLDIEASEFTSKFLHIYNNMKAANDGNKGTKRRKNVKSETKAK